MSVRSIQVLPGQEIVLRVGDKTHTLQLEEGQPTLVLVLTNPVAAAAEEARLASLPPLPPLPQPKGSGY